MAENGEFLHGQLARADARHALPAVFFLERCKFIRHVFKALVPGHFLHGAVRLANLRQRRGLDHGLLFVQGQTLDAAEAVVDRIALGGQHLNDAPVLHIEIHVAVQGAVIAGRLYPFHLHFPLLSI